LSPTPTHITLFTAGYQGHTIETFLDLLMAHGIAHVIDVRQLPFSRKPDFSKKRLTAHLAAVGIEYTHLVQLGTPKLLRDEVRHTRDYPAFFEAMDALVAAQPEAVQTALGIARAQPSALLCFEADPAECHRLSVARAIERLAGGRCVVVHL
jgi:uncharacterized protein (DUF488 family)